MARFAIDSDTAIRIARDGVVVAEGHKLVAPNRLMSDALATLYEQVRVGAVDRDEALAIIDGITTMGIRLLGDRVSRSVAWRIAEQLGWDGIGRAEYLSVAQLQADALVTDDAVLTEAATVPIAPLEDLTKKSNLS